MISKVSRSFSLLNSLMIDRMKILRNSVMKRTRTYTRYSLRTHVFTGNVNLVDFFTFAGRPVSVLRGQRARLRKTTNFPVFFHAKFIK